MKTAVLLLIAVIAAAQDQTGESRGSIKGAVVDSVTQQPVRKAVVRLNGSGSSPRNADEIAAAAPHMVVTDATGTFQMNDLPAGQYQLTVQQDNYPQARLGGVQKTVTVKPGQQTEPIIVLVPGASVSGRIFDEDGDPFNGCFVQIEPAKYSKQGAFRGSPGSRNREEDEGSYRLFDIAPGKYILKAQCQEPVFQPRPPSSGPDPLPSLAYPPQFYPGASNAELAEVIELAPGAEKSGIDFRMKPAAVTHIHVVLAGGAEWRGRKDLTWQLTPAEPLRSNIVDRWHAIDTESGVFDIPTVFPGSYKLMVTSGNPMGTPEVTGAMVGVIQQVDVGDKPVDVVLALRNGVDVPGRIEIEGSNASNPVPLNAVMVILNPELPTFYGGSGQPQSTKEDSSFTIKSAFPGPSRLTVNAPMAYLKYASLGGTELIDGKLDLSSGAQGELRILISTNTAAVHGTAPPGSMVFVAAVQQTSTSMSVMTDQSGQFKIEGLAPGKYRIGSGDQADLQGGNSQEITLAEGQILAVDIKPEGATP